MDGQDEARTYRVHLVCTVSTSVEVEATSIEDAIAQALEEAPEPVNSSNHGIDRAGEWTETAVYLGAEEVWDDSEGAY